MQNIYKPDFMDKIMEKNIDCNEEELHFYI